MAPLDLQSGRVCRAQHLDIWARPPLRHRGLHLSKTLSSLASRA